MADVTTTSPRFRSVQFFIQALSGEVYWVPASVVGEMAVRAQR